MMLSSTGEAEKDGCAKFRNRTNKLENANNEKAKQEFLADNFCIVISSQAIKKRFLACYRKPGTERAGLFIAFRLPQPVKV
jgi:hypothetical protein